MNRALISILIPAYRAGPYLGATLASVGAQTRRRWEVLVCEDGVFDDTAAVVRAFAATTTNPVRLCQNRSNGGVSRARNLLLDAAQGEYVAFLDADDLWTPDHLAYSLECMAAAHADWIIGGSNLVDPAGLLLKANLLPAAVPADEIPTRLLQHNFILTSAIVARSEVFGDHLRFDPSLAVGEDLDVWIQVVRQGFRPAFSRRATLNYRKHPTSATANHIRFSEEFSRVFEKYLGDPVVDQQICRGGIRNLLTTVARMTWRREPDRAVAALARLARVGPLPARSQAYQILALLSRQYQAARRTAGSKQRSPGQARSI